MTHLTSKRYGFQTGYFKGVEASITMSGPQNADQVSEGIKQVFAESKLPVKFVMVVYEGVTGDDKIDCYNEIKEP